MSLDASAAKAGRVRRAALRDGHARPLPHLPAPAEPGADLSAQARALRDLRRPACRADDPNRLSAPENMPRLREQPHLPRRLLRGGAVMIKESPLDPDAAQYRKVVPAGDYWMHVVRKGETLPHRRSRRQSGRRHAVLQRRRSRRALLGVRHHPRAGQHLSRAPARCFMSDLCRPMLTITADTVGRHDTLGGACATESNTVRYALDKKIDARLPRQLSARRRRERSLRADQARHRPQHQFLHERAGDARRRTCSSPTASPRPANMSRCAPRWT